MSPWEVITPLGTFRHSSAIRDTTGAGFRTPLLYLSIAICAARHAHIPGTGRGKGQRPLCSTQQWPPHNTSKDSWRLPSYWQHSSSYRVRGQTKCSARKMQQKGCWQRQRVPFSPCMYYARVCLGGLVLEIGVVVRSKKRKLTADALRSIRSTASVLLWRT